MQIGERIKKIRTFRHLTQRELGTMLGFTDSFAKQRISQYESGYRLPKGKTILTLANALNCNPINFEEAKNLGSLEKSMTELFWLEELLGNSFVIFPLNNYFDKQDSRHIYGFVNEYTYSETVPPIAIAIKYNELNRQMYEWALRYQELQQHLISFEEYFEWKINWPKTCEGESGQFTSEFQWRKSPNGN